MIDSKDYKYGFFKGVAMRFIDINKMKNVNQNEKRNKIPDSWLGIYVPILKNSHIVY